MRTPLFLQADRQETTEIATLVLPSPAFLFALKDQTLTLLLLASGVWLWGLIHLVSPAVAADDALGTLEREVHTRVNKHRQTMCLRPLAYNDEIARQARRHSQAMASGRGDVDHHGVEERRATLLRSIGFSAFAENVAVNNSEEFRTAEAAVQGWLKSPGHRRNLEGTFTLTGVGVTRSATGFYFFTQIFLTPLDTSPPHTGGDRPDLS
jgi:uncharacterized protein YkwD